MNCATTAKFPDRERARRVIQDLRRLYLLSTTFYCGSCDAYHVDASANLKPFDLQVLTLRSQGFSLAYIEKEMKVNRRRVQEVFWRLNKRFYVSNLAQLVCVAMALGILDPTPFVPTLKEAKHG